MDNKNKIKIEKIDAQIAKFIANIENLKNKISVFKIQKKELSKKK